MTAILRSLIWKEFHELKWKAAALVAVAVGVPVAIKLRDGSFPILLTLLILLVNPL